MREAGDLGLVTARNLMSNHTGISLRDAAALAALQGFCSQADTEGMWSWLPDVAAAEAWRVADAFIAARDQRQDYRKPEEIKE